MNTSKSAKPISFIMRTQVSDLEVPDIEAGIDHLDRMIQRLQDTKREFEAERKRRSKTHMYCPGVGFASSPVDLEAFIIANDLDDLDDEVAQALRSLKAGESFTHENGWIVTLKPYEVE